MKHLLFYTTEGCHLCEIAEGLIAQTIDFSHCRVEVVEISESDALIERYGVRIPVLADEQSQAELGWPFDQQQLVEFVSALSKP